MEQLKARANSVQNFEELVKYEPNLELQKESLATKVELAPKKEPKINRFCSICNLTVSGSLNQHGISAHMADVNESHYLCAICNKNILKSWAKTHFYQHNVRFEEPRECGVCFQQFTEVYRYETHLSRHRKLECHHCGKKMTDKKRLGQHILTKHFAIKRCYRCGELFSDTVAYAEHMKAELLKYRSKDAQVCDICGYGASTKQVLSQHKSRRHSTQTYPCTKCGKTFKSDLNLKYHHKREHEKAQFACDQCGMEFIERRPMVLHIRRMHEPTRYTRCEICNKMISEGSIKRHVVLVHGPDLRKFVCKLCGRAFKIKALLEKHSYSHQKLRPYNCHLCSIGKFS